MVSGGGTIEESKTFFALDQRGHVLAAPKGQRLKAQGCRFDYPGNENLTWTTASRLRPPQVPDATALRLGFFNCTSKGSRSGNPGL
jgi:hypothetical protein